MVHDLKIPCITVEIGEFTTGYLNMGDLQRIWPRTRALPLVAAQNLRKMKGKKKGKKNDLDPITAGERPATAAEG